MKKFLVTIQLADASPQNLAIVAPRINKELGRLSRAPIELAFRSKSGDLFGYVVASERVAGQILAAVTSPVPLPILSGDDKAMVVELGNEGAFGPGFTRLGTWCQRRTWENQ